MRKMILGLTALLLSACGGETYQVDAERAYLTLSEIGTPSVIEPMPSVLYPVSVRFEALPRDKAVQWLFSHDGEDLGRLVATVSPDGSDASSVTLAFQEGTAPDENWINGKARTLIQNGIYRLVAEAIDSKFENRSYDMALRAEIDQEMTVASVGEMMKGANDAMDQAIEQQKRAEKEWEAEAARNPYAAGRPTTDLSNFN